MVWMAAVALKCLSDAVDGTVDNLYALNSIFLWAIAGSTLTFDVAHAQYKRNIHRPHED